MTSPQLLVDSTHGPAPAPLPRVYRNATTESPFHSLPANVECKRCNQPVNIHHWLIHDSDVAEQGGVLDCGWAE